MGVTALKTPRQHMAPKCWICWDQYLMMQLLGPVPNDAAELGREQRKNSAEDTAGAVRYAWSWAVGDRSTQVSFAPS